MLLKNNLVMTKKIKVFATAKVLNKQYFKTIITSSYIKLHAVSGSLCDVKATH